MVTFTKIRPNPKVIIIIGLKISLIIGLIRKFKAVNIITTLIKS